MTQLLGRVIADFETQLATKISIAGTTATLASATDDDGVALPAGRYFFTIDKDSSKKEHISCTLSGKSLTNIKTVSRQGVEVAGVVREHRVGANVIISDFAHLKKMNDLLDGTTSFDSATPLGYDGAPSITTGNQLATKTYVDTRNALDVQLTGDQTITSGVKTFIVSPIVPTPTNATDAANKAYADALAIAGAPNASTTVKGIVEIATQAELEAGTDVGGTGAALVPTPSQLNAVYTDTLVAGEALTADDAVFIASGTESIIINAQSTTNTVRETQTLIYQSFTTGPSTTRIEKIIMFWDTNGGSAAATLTLRTTPGGADMFTPISTGLQNYVAEWGFVIPGGIAVSPSTTYYIICTGTFKGGTTSSYASGVSGYWNGGSWVTPAPIVTGDFYFKVFEGNTIAGRAYKTTANSNITLGSEWTTNFLGFVVTSVASLANVMIHTLGTYNSLAGLSPGATYYVSNTVGAISSTAGTTSKKVGVALSATTLLIKHDN